MGDPLLIFPPDVPDVSPLDRFKPIEPITDIPKIDAPPPVQPVKRTKDPKVDAFFLPPVDDSDPLVFRGDIEDSLNVTPIIDGNEIFAELEPAIANAESSVLIAFWAFDPGMKAVTDPSVTWMDLLLEAVENGAMVRVLFNDFDSGLQVEPHAVAWERYWTMLTAAVNAGTRADKFQVVCSHHEAETSRDTMKAVRPELYKTVAAELNKLPVSTRKRVFSVAPGLWTKLNLKHSKLEEIFAGHSYSAFPATHHQKIVIVDGKIAFTGGLNVTDQYLDTPKHRKRELPWHDVFVKVEGATVRQFVRNFIGLWNQERLRAEAFLKDAYRAMVFKVHARPMIGPTSNLTEAMIPTVLTSALPAKIPSQVHRTITKKGTADSGVPIVIRKDILEGYVQAISQAESFIYLENQYFREEIIADAIVKQHKDKPDLQTIILLPKVIEEFLKSKGDELSQHGAALQFELLDKMNRAIGSKLGLFTLERNDKKLVYVHSKLLIIDDKFASIGSANCNPRSFKMDTELDFVWFNEAVAQKLRIDLWKEVLGNPSGLDSWKPAEFITKWTEIAKKNKRSRRTRKGFVVPFDNSTKGKKSFFPITPFT